MKPKSIRSVVSVVSVLFLPFAVQAAEVDYQTGFEPPAFTPGLPIRGQDNWEMFHDGEAISGSTLNPKSGAQSLRFDGALLEQTGPNSATAYCFSRPFHDFSDPDNPVLLPLTPPIVEIRASVRLDGPQTGTLGTPEQDLLSANLMAVTPRPDGQGDLLGGFFVSSAGRIWTYSPVPEDNYKYSVPYTFGEYRDLALRVNFIVRRLTWFVDGVELGSASFPASITTDQLVSGYLYLNGNVDPIDTPELTYDMANYTAWFDDYSIASIPVGGPGLVVEQPAGVPLQNGLATIDFGAGKVGTGIPQVFTLRNRGDADLTGATIAVEGPHAAEFTVTAPPAATVNPDGNTTFTVTFTPAETGPRTASLRIAADGVENPFSVGLIGIGLPAVEIAQQAYIKAFNTGADDRFGGAVAIDGDTMVVGAPREDSSARGVNGNEANNSASNSGAAYVFVRDGTNWTQQAYLKASNTGTEDYFGTSVSISGDTIVVGAVGESSIATGVNGNQADNSAEWSGAAYVFVREGTNWTQQAYLKASNTDRSFTAPWGAIFYLDLFGQSVSVSGDTIVVGAPWEASGGRGVNGNQNNNYNFEEAGAAYVFVREGTNWTQQAYLKASNTGRGDHFGFSVALDGNTVVIGAKYEASNATGVNGQNNDSTFGAGAAYVFVRDGTTWTQQAYLKASNTERVMGADIISDTFGVSVSVSGDTIVVGAPRESSNATGVNGDQSDNSARHAGAAYVFLREGTTWTQQAYLKASNTGAGDAFSGSDETWNNSGVAISGDTVVVGALLEDSNATGVNGDQANNSSRDSGAVYVFTGLGPAPSAAPLRLLVAGPPTDGFLRLTLDARPGASCTLQVSEDLATWTDLTTQTATTTQIEFTDTPPASANRFYRVKQAE